MARWVGLCALLAMVGCLQRYDVTVDAGSPYTDEDAGTGYQLDLSGDDFASGPVTQGHYHPDGYAASTVHGLEMKLQVQDCRNCHGQTLEGGVAGAGGGTLAPPTCDSCHQSGWRTNCTFCHGTDGKSPAPPRDIDGQTDPLKITFPGHVAHVSGRIAPSFDCVQCHRKPTDVLSAYHIFDASPRRGENDLSGGLSKAGVYDPVLRQCTNLYCHGTGRADTGVIAASVTGPLACSSCHADMSVPNAWGTMSSDHRRHLGINGTDCTSCHNQTVAAAPGAVSNPALHINGKADVGMAAATGITYDAATKRCTGSCHGENHNGRAW